jgi:hypothetical protein
MRSNVEDTVPEARVPELIRLLGLRSTLGHLHPLVMSLVPDHSTWLHYR